MTYSTGALPKLLHVTSNLMAQCAIHGRYTLGGFYLARYSDSPVGKFDEVRSARAQEVNFSSRSSAVGCSGNISTLFLEHEYMNLNIVHGAAGGASWSCLESSHVVCMGGQSLCKQWVCFCATLAQHLYQI